MVLVQRSLGFSLSRTAEEHPGLTGTDGHMAATFIANNVRGDRIHLAARLRRLWPGSR